ncbi:MAG: SUF system NifU family Fe-S cluster assembly protein [Candidatus Eisenbacteria bacterium]|uniref:SUF system NifU family Fe-S cluster assembly protein n=1 Tax=Eiseniibacteriota bacterium TaxID=2212470 RepID=A0A948RZX4_UNCEI|nr:SUF system NifU family Fe-S cluster assembly protein [Candidatus Eisenbacteria bacterium]MBU1949824.1 SUF system NifU family Fe-S cluster assembly protein [Candidatus Eisenbacteria bacterium]MBU2692717.1 SUF system NifU family Fe-S cluster assembly protein [Candidatus Eisenbacteria bacterium]
MKSTELDALYRKVLLDHYRDPRCRDPISSPTHRQKASNPLCGDETSLAVELVDGRFLKIQVRSGGCSICVASGSMMGEIVQGRTEKETRRIADAFQLLMKGSPIPDNVDLGDLRVLEGVLRFPERVKCATLPWVALEGILLERERELEGDQKKDREK